MIYWDFVHYVIITEEILKLKSSEHIRIADMSKGKANDDDYRVDMFITKQVIIIIQ